MQILKGKILPGEHIIMDRDGKKDVVRFEHVPAKQAGAAANK